VAPKKLERLMTEMYEQTDRLIAAIDKKSIYDLNQSIAENHLRLMKDELRDMEKNKQ